MCSKADILIENVECFLPMNYRRNIFTWFCKYFIENLWSLEKFLYNFSNFLLIIVLTGMLPATVMLESNTCQVSSDIIIKMLLVEKISPYLFFFFQYFKSLQRNKSLGCMGMKKCRLMDGWIDTDTSVCEQLVLTAVPQESCSVMSIFLLCLYFLLIFSTLKVFAVGIQLIELIYVKRSTHYHI